VTIFIIKYYQTQLIVRVVLLKFNIKWVMKGECYMDQLKVGKFIKRKRKEMNLTQSELAEKLNITDRAISKWENGNCMPDVSIISELCGILNVTINDLFSGKKVDMKNNEKILEENLLEMARIKEQRDKELLTLEFVIGILSIINLLSLTFVASFFEMVNWLRILIVIIGVVPSMIGILFALRIEQIAGYYVCAKCHHKYVPKYSRVLWAMHINRTRYMRCPKCNQKSWNKKVIK